MAQTLASPANLFLFDMAAGKEGAFGASLCGEGDALTPAVAAHRDQLVGLAVMLTGCFLEHSSDALAPVEDDAATATETARKRVLNMIARRVGFDGFSAALQTVIDGPFFVAANRLRFRSSVAAGAGSGAAGSPTIPAAAPRSSWIANTAEDNAADGAVLGMDSALLFDPPFVRLFRQLRATVNRTMIDAYTGGGESAAAATGDQPGLDTSLPPEVMAQMLQQYVSFRFVPFRFVPLDLVPRTFRERARFVPRTCFPPSTGGGRGDLFSSSHPPTPPSPPPALPASHPHVGTKR